jgi:rubrerythrin
LGQCLTLYTIRLQYQYRYLQIKYIEICSWQEVNSQGKKWKQEFDSDSIEILKHRFNEEVDAVNFYELCAKFLAGSSDTTTYDLFKEIKEDEEQHVLDLRDLGLGVGVDIEA